MAPASLPASGSLMAMASADSPAQTGGMYFSFAASVPNMSTARGVTIDWP